MIPSPPTRAWGLLAGPWMGPGLVSVQMSAGMGRREVTVHRGVGTSGKCACWPRAREEGVPRGRRAAPAGLGLRKRELGGPSHMLALPKKPTVGVTPEGRGACDTTSA